MDQQQQIMSKDRDSLVEKETLNSFLKVYPPIFNVVLSMLVVGFSITYLSIFDAQELAAVYGQKLKDKTSFAILNSSILLAAGFGGLVSGFVLTKFRRTRAILLFNLIYLVGTVLVVSVNNYFTLLTGRVLQGLAMGGLSSVVPLINREYSPNSIAGSTGAMNNFFIILGIVYTQLQHFLIYPVNIQNPPNEVTIKVIFGIPLVVILVQSLLILIFFDFQTPKYYLINGMQLQARKAVQRFYNPSQVQSILLQKNDDAKQIKNSSQLNQNMTKGAKLRIIVAISLPVMQQITGVNIILLYASDFFSGGIKDSIGLIINCVQLLTNFSVGFLLARFGRKQILLVGLFVIVAFNAANAVGFWTEINEINAISTIGFFAFFGASAGPIVWQYIPEIVQSKTVGYTTFLNWFTGSLVTFVYKFIDGQPGIVFMGLAVLTLWVGLFLLKYMVETKDKSDIQIKAEYQLL